MQILTRKKYVIYLFVVFVLLLFAQLFVSIKCFEFYPSLTMPSFGSKGPSLGEIIPDSDSSRINFYQLIGVNERNDTIPIDHTILFKHAPKSHIVFVMRRVMGRGIKAHKNDSEYEQRVLRNFEDWLRINLNNRGEQFKYVLIRHVSTQALKVKDNITAEVKINLDTIILKETYFTLK
jgi:hypothetical protein